MTRSVKQKRADFKALHQQGCFIIPNPYDVGTARMLEGLGFKALATTSSGFAWTQGLPDGERVTREVTLAHLRTLAAATDLPLNADFESGYAEDAAGVAESVRMAIATGVAGLSIEDATGDDANPLRSIEESVRRIQAARAAIDEPGGDTLLVGRAENFIVGRPDLDDTIKRLQAFSKAGADVLYAPGLRDIATIKRVVAAVDKPVNVVIGGIDPAITLQQLADAGVKRVSIGGALSRLAYAAVRDAAVAMRDQGSFAWLREAMPGKDLKALFRQ